MSFSPQYIGSDFAGLVNNVKPFLIFDAAFQTLMNAYSWRNRIKKREGLQFLNRLRRIFTATVTAGIAFPANSTTIFNLFTQLGINKGSTEPNAQIELGNISNITIAFGAPLNQTWTDSTGTGVMTGFAPTITSVSINYNIGDITVVNGAVAFGASVPTITVNYYPSLPVMGICLWDQPGNYNQITILFDTIYAYQYVGSGFQQLGAPTIWHGGNNDFFSYANFRGSTADTAYFFVTNFVNTLPGPIAGDPIRYFNGTVWTNLIPVIAASNQPPAAPASPLFFMTQARFLIPYYGRLVALNVFEAPESIITPGTPDYTATKNIFNRCRFSQIGDPTQVNAWRSDAFGLGGFIDAPVNESIVNATFYKNTLIVFFQRSTWALRYVGEYGLPFLWERISSDFGSQSTFSPVLFDDGVLAISDRAIVTSAGNDVQRIDLQIPDLVFDFEDANEAHRRIQGVRDFQKELIYWCYPDGSLNRTFPNFTLVYNYRNQSYAIFRNNITAFGKFNSPSGITWDSLTTMWTDPNVTWNTFLQTGYLDTISGNQQGYIHFFGDPNSASANVSLVAADDQESLTITAINRSLPALTFTVPNHNLEQGEIIYITGVNFVNTATGAVIPTSINFQFYRTLAYIDANTIAVEQWNFVDQLYGSNFAYTPINGTGTYMGGGQITLFPVMQIVTKDFNPLAQQGLQAKFGHLDLLTDATDNAAVTVQLYRNSSFASKANMIVGQKNTTTALTPNGYITAITNTNPCQITTLIPYNVATGSLVLLSSIQGVVLGALSLNGNTFPITVVDQFNFTIPLNTTAYSAYISAGDWSLTNYPYYPDESQYAWHRFYAGTYGSFFSLSITYDDNLMNTLSTHQEDFVLNAFRIWTKPGSAGVY